MSGGDRDVLSAEGIGRELEKKYADSEIYVMNSVDSTNQEVKRRARAGAGQRLVVLAEEQTAGRGRKGRSFFSPPGSGIYMSVLFRPDREKAGNAVLVTTAAAVAVCRAIRTALGEEPEIKWVNDIYFKGKKVCGILAEAVTEPESGKIDAVVVGIGINCKLPKGAVPAELTDIIGDIFRKDSAVSRNSLAAAVLNELFSLYDELDSRSFMDDYRRWSNVIGREVRFTSGDEWRRGTAVDIDEDGGLIVHMPDGGETVLKTGEITLRIDEGRE